MENLAVHGLYRLFEDHNPRLVAEFDETQPFPWDAGFHRWCDEHPMTEKSDIWDAAPKPLAQIMKGKVPSWMPKPFPLYDVELLACDESNEEVMEIVEECLNWFGIYKPECVVGKTPIRILFETDREHAERICECILDAGGKSKVHVTTGKPFCILL